MMKTTRLSKETALDLNKTDRGFPDFRIGDTINIAQKIKEGNKERIQSFEGDVIAFHNNGIATTFTVRKIGANGVGVERIYPLYSPNISEIKFVKRGRVRRAKLGYLRDRVGRAGRVKELVMSKDASNKESSGIPAKAVPVQTAETPNATE
jgi:large subunit ribosomal protein L19